MRDRSKGVSRRRFLASVGVGTTVVLGGCARTSNKPGYESRSVNETAGDPRTANEMVAAEALAQQDANESASPLSSLELGNHQFVVKKGYKGPTVQGTASNTGNGLLTFAEVRVRVYDDTGAQIGRYLDTTGDLTAGATWRFEVILLASAKEIAKYDIALVGIPD